MQCRFLPRGAAKKMGFSDPENRRQAAMKRTQLALVSVFLPQVESSRWNSKAGWSSGAGEI